MLGRMSDPEMPKSQEERDRALEALLETDFGAQLLADYEDWAHQFAETDVPVRLVHPPDRRLITELAAFDRELIRHLHRGDADLRQLQPREFEVLVAALWEGFGYEVELTKRTRDGGMDVIAIRRRQAKVKFLIECKAPPKARLIGPEPVRALLGVAELQRATKAILATTVRFSPGAKAIFEQREWDLEGRDRDGVLEWIADYVRDVQDWNADRQAYLKRMTRLEDETPRDRKEKRRAVRAPRRHGAEQACARLGSSLERKDQGQEDRCHRAWPLGQRHDVCDRGVPRPHQSSRSRARRQASFCLSGTGCQPCFAPESRRTGELPTRPNFRDQRLPLLSRLPSAMPVFDRLGDDHQGGYNASVTLQCGFAGFVQVTRTRVRRW